MQITSLRDLLTLGLQEAVSMEEQITKALPQLVEKASSQALKDALNSHLEETRKQQQTVQDLCKEFSVEAAGVQDAGMAGIIQKGQQLLEGNSPSPVLDLAIIAAAQKVEHYEIACYGTLANYAQEMGNEDAQDLLHKIMEEEKMTDEQLTTLAESLIPQVKP